MTLIQVSHRSVHADGERKGSDDGYVLKTEQMEYHDELVGEKEKSGMMLTFLA